MMHHDSTNNTNRERSYLNTILTVVAALLAIIAFDLVVGTPAPSEAMAGPASSTGGGLINPEAQRQEILVEVRRLSAQMTKLNTALGGTIDVNVIRMPAGGDGD